MNKKTTLLLSLLLFVAFARAQYINIPDSNFRKYLITQIPKCFNRAGLMDTTCKNVTNSTTYIDCSNSQIRDLTGIEYFKQLYFLNCSGNLLQSLPTSLNNISRLDCSNNQLTSLPILSYIYQLDCSNNLLKSLPTLPLVTISYLYCNNNFLTSLPNLSNRNIDRLDCSNNLLTSLPNMANCFMPYLNCSHNYLTSLPTLSDTLMYLSCNDNQLISLPILPRSLQTLDCSNNFLNYLPTLTNSTWLTILACSKNPDLYCLPTLPPYLASLAIDTNNIVCLPNYPNGMQVYQDTIDSVSIINFTTICNAFNNAHQCQALPVILSSYTASPTPPKDGQKTWAALNIWTTASEINTDHFNIQRSMDGERFITIGTIKAKGVGDYSYKDSLPLVVTAQYYRLQMVDKDGSISYSKVVFVQLAINNYQLATIYPNPAKDYMIIEGKGVAQVSVIDNNGRMALTQKTLPEGEQNKIPLHLAKGIYLVQIKQISGTVTNQKLVVE